MDGARGTINKGCFVHCTGAVNIGLQVGDGLCVRGGGATSGSAGEEGNKPGVMERRGFAAASLSLFPDSAPPYVFADFLRTHRVKGGGEDWMERGWGSGNRGDVHCTRAVDKDKGGWCERGGMH